MKKRTQEQWQTLITDYEESGLTITAFCDEQKICRKHFGERRKQLLNQATIKSNASFVPIALPPQHDRSMLTLQQGNNLVLKIPLSVSPNWLAEFIQQLQA